MTDKALIAQARRLADEQGISQVPGAPETAVAFTLRELATALEKMHLKAVGL